MKNSPFSEKYFYDDNIDKGKNPKGSWRNSDKLIGLFLTRDSSYLKIDYWNIEFPEARGVWFPVGILVAIWLDVVGINLCLEMYTENPGILAKGK